MAAFQTRRSGASSTTSEASDQADSATPSQPISPTRRHHMLARSHTLTLNNGVELPALGFGVFQSPPAQTVDAVETALKTGYRLIDTAAAYANEREVGEGIRRSGLARDEVFIETKVWISDYGYESALHAFQKGTRKLGVERLDLLILHQPLPTAFDRTLEAYRALETLLADGS